MQFNINIKKLNTFKRLSMVNKTLLLSTITACSLLLSACATKHATSYPPFTPELIGKDRAGIKYTQKTQTVFALIDTFSTINTIYDSANAFESKFTIQKQVLNQINKTIPEDITLYSGLRSFGYGECTDETYSGLLQDIIPHERYTFQYNIDKATCASGRSLLGAPLTTAIDAASTDLDKAKGNIALIIVSDGYNMSFRAKIAAENLKEKFSNRLCIYSVWIGNEDEKEGQVFLKELAELSKCGESVSYTNIASSETMGRFVEDIIYKKSALEKIPLALRDTDKDSVFGNRDLCPETPKGAPANIYGCWTIHGLEFDFNKANIRKDSEGLLDASAKILKDNPYLNIQIEGHTDNRGSDNYNLLLSDRRAASVRKYLIKKGIKATRLSSIGMGESTPITSNDTDKGRQLNRRVVFTITK
ncbi:MAG: OmpA family protein [Methyloprofundus sp.]|nr:OmpA family protein [Methyloprofundus sp.]